MASIPYNETNIVLFNEFDGLENMFDFGYIHCVLDIGPYDTLVRLCSERITALVCEDEVHH